MSIKPLLSYPYFTSWSMFLYYKQFAGIQICETGLIEQIDDIRYGINDA